MSLAAYLIVGVIILIGFCAACYACCACPSGQLDEAFWSPLDDMVAYEEAKEMRRRDEH
jgi:hypothetical protein